jgi:hypothetical protein
MKTLLAQDAKKPNNLFLFYLANTAPLQILGILHEIADPGRTNTEEPSSAPVKFFSLAYNNDSQNQIIK